MVKRERWRARSVSLALAAVALGLVACGDDGANRIGSSAGAALSKEAFCAAMAKINAPFEEAGQYASREQKVEAAKKVVDLLDAAAKIAPSDITDAAKTKLDAIRTAAGGETSALIESEALDATQKIKDYCPA